MYYVKLAFLQQKLKAINYLFTFNFRNITDIRITQMFVDEAYKSVILVKGKNDFKTDLYIKDSKSGVSKICLIATDSNGLVLNMS